MFVVAAPVQLLRLREQGQAELDQSGAVGQVVVGGLEPFGKVRPLGLDLTELLLDLQDREGGVGGEIEQVGLLGIQAVELSGEPAPEEPRGGFLVGQCRSDVASDVVDEVGAEADGGVVGLDRVFDADGADVWGVAHAAAAVVGAEEVQVLAAVPVDDALDDQLLGDVAFGAVTAEQAALEVVVVVDPALFGLGPGLDQVLHLAEEVLVDQGVVAPFELLALVGDDAEVIEVAQHLGELVDRYLPGRVPLRGAGAEPAVVELVGEVGEGVVAGGVELEGELDQVRAFGVDGDGADLAEL